MDEKTDTWSYKVALLLKMIILIAIINLFFVLFIYVYFESEYDIDGQFYNMDLREQKQENYFNTHSTLEFIIFSWKGF